MKTQRQLLKISSITPVSDHVRCYRLTEANGGKLVPFLPGQYLNLFYSIGDARTSRPYSIASSPQEAEEHGYYDLYIHGGGSFTSEWLFHNGYEGMTIEASAPEGNFCLDPAALPKKVIGISGGMSVTPLRSMARAVGDGTLKDMELTLFCGWDRHEDALFYREFKELEAQCSQFHAVFLSRDDVAEGFEHGRMTLRLLQAYTDPEESVFFLCGPESMYRSLKGEFRPLGIPAHQYHYELPGEVKAGAAGTEKVIRKKLFTLSIVDEEGKTSIPLRSDETILIALERAGIPTQARCRSGQCGYCGAKLLSGQVFVPERWKRKETDDVLHPCCSFPLNDLEIRLS